MRVFADAAAAACYACNLLTTINEQYFKIASKDKLCMKKLPAVSVRHSGVSSRCCFTASVICREDSRCLPSPFLCPHLPPPPQPPKVAYPLTSPDTTVCIWTCRHTTPYSLLANGLLMCRFAAPLAFNFMAAVAIPPSSRHSQGDRDVQDTVMSTVTSCNMHSNKL